MLSKKELFVLDYRNNIILYFMQMNIVSVI